MKIAIAARSEPNVLRSNNEDNLYCVGFTLTPETCNESFVLDEETDAPCVVAVFDGMGGMAKGEYAALVGARALEESAAGIMAADEDSVNAAVQKYVADTNQSLCQAMREQASNFGTTLALVVITENSIRAYNLGDSRIYALTEEGFQQVSVDHTLAAQKVRLGFLTPEQALTDKGRNRLTLYLGIFEDEFSVMAEEVPPLPCAGIHRLLLCTDGLTDKLSDADLEETLRSTATVGEAASRLVEQALEGGSRDNVTCIVCAPVRA